jgi:hypothetical protein
MFLSCSIEDVELLPKLAADIITKDCFMLIRGLTAVTVE